MVSAFAFEDAVRLRDAGALTHWGNMGWIDAMNDYRSFDGVEGWARHYWQGDKRDPKTWEAIG